jgi:hypothetical protein
MPLTDAMRYPVNLTFRLHAIKRMFERKVDADHVRHILETGEVIEDYPTDTPYPSCLVLGWRGTRPLHIVVACNAMDNETIIITAFEPDPKQWNESFKRRRS